MERTIQADILVCISNGAVQQVVTTEGKSVAVIEVFANSQIPLLTEMDSVVMSADEINSTAQGAYNLGQMTKEEDNG